MAYDPGLADIFRDDLAATSGVVEKRMFGGLVFMLDGNMLCGVHKDGAMMRVGKDREAEALTIPGASPMDFGPRKMAGFIDLDTEAMADDAIRARLLGLALDFVTGLPPK